MADNSKFSDVALRTIQLSPVNGKVMLAISRAILSGSYTDDEFNQDFFVIFIAIDDQNDHIILDGFGEFNTASARFMLSSNPMRNFLKAALVRQEIDARSNTEIYQDDLEDIEKVNRRYFESSLREFKAYFRLNVN